MNRGYMLLFGLLVAILVVSWFAPTAERPPLAPDAPSDSRDGPREDAARDGAPDAAPAPRPTGWEDGILSGGGTQGTILRIGFALGVVGLVIFLSNRMGK